MPKFVQRGSQCLVICVAAICAHAQSAQKSDEVIGEVFASDAGVQGSVVLAAGGASLLSGSTVEAGSTPVLVKLRRGGTLRVCPGSTLSMSATQATEQASPTLAAKAGLMFSLDTGAIETGYELGAAADSLITPDFRILLSGPGAFHLAVGADAKGNTCVHSLPGNTAALVVTELMGSGSYQVKPQETVLFRGGHVAEPSADPGACGCPATTAPAIETAQVKKAEEPVATPAELPQPAAAPPVEPQPAPLALPVESQPAPAAKPGEVQVQVDAPFVFNAAAAGPSLATVASLRLEPVPDLPEPQVQAPEPASATAPSPVTRNKPSKRGFFGRLRGFFASIFGK